MIEDDLLIDLKKCGSPEDMRRALKRVLKSRSFVASPRLSRFFAFTVERALEGKEHALKEYIIATEVYDRWPDFDPIQDSIVRTEARRLRRKLKEYYEGEGSADEIVFCFRTGSYIPACCQQPQNLQDSGEAPQRAVAVQKEPISMPLGVKPFQAATDDPLARACAFGITEELFHRLSRMPSVSVICLDSRAASREVSSSVGHEASPTIRISGSVQCDMDRIRVSARVVTASGFLLLAQRFESEAENGGLLALQESIVVALLGRIIPYYPPNYHHAANNYPSFSQISAELLAAEGLLEDGTVPSISEALPRLERLVLAAPDYARIHCSIGKCCLALVVRGVRDRGGLRQRGLDACHRALQLDPGVADGHANLGCLLGADWRWEEGEKSLLKAIALVDQCSTRWLYGMHLLMLRRWEEAWYSFSISAALDQLSPRRRIALERFRYYSGQFTQAPGEQLKIKRFEDVPTEALLFNALGEVQRGAVEQALAIANYVRNQHPEVPAYLATIAEVHALCGKIDEANAIVKRCDLLADGAALSDFRKAGLCITREMHEDVLRWLERSFASREPDLVWMYADQRFSELRENAMFLSIARGIFGDWGVEDIADNILPLRNHEEAACRT